ncbi:MAG TPA: hypothetical protein VIW69_15040 [Candidatus Elarobacter sp.]
MIDEHVVCDRDVADPSAVRTVEMSRTKRERRFEIPLRQRVERARQSSEVRIRKGAERRYQPCGRSLPPSTVARRQGGDDQQNDDRNTRKRDKLGTHETTLQSLHRRD